MSICIARRIDLWLVALPLAPHQNPLALCCTALGLGMALHPSSHCTLDAARVLSAALITTTTTPGSWYDDHPFNIIGAHVHVPACREFARSEQESRSLSLV